jgi:ribonuclease HI
VVQNRALRLITGQFKSSPVEALQAEAEVPSYTTHSERSWLRSMEKAKRLPTDHPRRMALDEAASHRTPKSTSWMTEGRRLSMKLKEAQDISPISIYQMPPWIDYQVEIFPELPGISSRAEDESKRRDAAIARIRELNSDLTIYTDGSATAGTRRGGAGVVVTQGDPESPICIETIMEKGAPHTSSYEEEHSAMKSALKWIGEKGNEFTSILICTDSQSLCKALHGSNDEVDDLSLPLSQCSPSISIQWIPGHSGIPGNDLADQAAKDAAKLIGEARGTSYRGIVPAIKAAICDPPIPHERTRMVYSEYSKLKERSITSRKDRVLLARIRTGHHLVFLNYQHRLNQEIDRRCPRCQYWKDDVLHWLNCEALMHVRMQIFGTAVVEPSILTNRPRESVVYAQRTLCGTE